MRCNIYSHIFCIICPCDSIPILQTSQTVSFCRGVYITNKTDSKILKFSVIGLCGMCLHGEIKNRIWRFQTVADPINASCCVSGKLVKTGEWYRSITNAKEWFCSDSILKREFFRDFNLKVYIWFLELKLFEPLCWFEAGDIGGELFYALSRRKRKQKTRLIENLLLPSTA